MAGAIDPEPPDATPDDPVAGERIERHVQGLSDKEVAELEARIRDNRRPYDREEQAKEIVQRAVRGT
jgi:hypothetical protein